MIKHLLVVLGLLLVGLVACVTDWESQFPHTQISKNLPDDIKNDLPKIINYRFGLLDESDMLTTEIRGYVEPHTWYRFKPGSLKKVSSPRAPQTHVKQRTPKFLRVKGEWSNKISYAKEEANVLGGFGTFVVDVTHLDIPLEEANEDNLEYYNGQFVRTGDLVRIVSSKNLPVSVVRFDRNYIDGYLSRPQLGGGFYLEVHDAPHFWSSLNEDSSGFIVLGKKVGEYYHLTAYSIPYGCGVYIEGGTIHFDGSLTGEQFVIYTVTPDYSTVHVKNRKGSIVRFNAV